jgi:hypothetical protein
MFSQTVDYALRPAVLLAADPQVAHTSEQVVGCTRVPRGYLSKVLQQMVKANLIHSQSGLHAASHSCGHLIPLRFSMGAMPSTRSNGFRHAHWDAKRINKDLCPLHCRLDDAPASIEKAFGEITLAKRVVDPNQHPPLCNITVEGDTR